MHTVSTLPISTWLNALLAAGGVLVLLAVVLIFLASWAGVEVTRTSHD